MKTNRLFLLFLLSIFPVLGIHAQDIADDDETCDSTEQITDSLGMIAVPPMTWEESLRFRLDSMINRYRTTTVTTKQRISRRSRRYKTVTKSITRPDRIGVAVFDLTADSLLYTHNAEDRYIPASNQKVFVAVTALDNLGTGYHFKTDVLVGGEIKKDTLNHDYLDGNIYIHGRFDPTLDNDAAQYIARRVEALGIDSITGGVYCYEPLKNRTESGTWFWNRHVSRTFAQRVLDNLSTDSIHLASNKLYGTVEYLDSIPMHTLMSIATPMEAVLYRMMKRSDNAYAESMLLSLTDQDSISTWSYEACRDKVRQMISRAQSAGSNKSNGSDGLNNLSGFFIEGGSGLSHNNRTTPLMLCEVLRYAFHKQNIYRPLMQSLPIAGIDGTIRNRMKGTEAYDNVRAKTGTVNGVSTLSGYCTAANGHRLCFSILMNTISGQSTAKSLQNILCTEMCR